MFVRYRNNGSARARLLFFVAGGLPRAWSTPSLSPFVRSGLKPPLLQQAAFDDLIFKVDVMRNVASRHTQKEDEEELEDKEPSHKWCSLPTINMPEKEEHKSNGEEVHNEDEGLQEVSDMMVCKRSNWVYV